MEVNIKRILRNIRLNNLKGFIIFSILAVPIICMSIIGIIKSDENIFMFAIMGVMGIFMSSMMIKYLIVLVDPYKSHIFKKYGNVFELERILNEINDTIEYEDKNLIIAKNYIVDKKDFESLVAVNDILRVHKLVHKTNLAIDYYGVIITDKYNHEINFTYGRKEEKKVDELVILIGIKSNNSVIGYSKGTQEYVDLNKEELADFPNQPTKVEIKEHDKQKEYIGHEIKYCSKCGRELRGGWSFCSHCGNKMNEKWNDETSNEDIIKNSEKSILKLLDYKKLLDKGVITQDEYDKKKKEYL